MGRNPFKQGVAAYERRGRRVGDDDELHWYLVKMPRSLHDTIFSVLCRALSKANGQQKAAAAILEITPEKMSDMVQKYGLATPHDVKPTRKKKEKKP